MATTSGKDPGDQAREAAQAAREQAARMAEQARETGEHIVSERKDHLAHQVSGLADVLRRGVEQLNTQEQHMSAQLAETLAGGLDQLSDTLRSNDINSLMTRAQEFARRQPAVFLGGAIAAGFLVARFLKYTSPTLESAQKHSFAQDKTDLDDSPKAQAENDAFKATDALE